MSDERVVPTREILEAPSKLKKTMKFSGRTLSEKTNLQIVGVFFYFSNTHEQLLEIKILSIKIIF